MNGVCLTVVEINIESMSACFDVVAETINKTNLSYLKIEDEVNVELSLRYGDFVGGHMVQGHVDGIGKVTSIVPEGDALLVAIEANKDILKYLVNKGFVTIDGMSITVIDVYDNHFTVTFIPHTQNSTIVRKYKCGSVVNLEADPIGKQIHSYMEKLQNVWAN